MRLNGVRVAFGRLLRGVLLGAAAASAVAASPACGLRADIAAQLAADWDERPVARGLTVRGDLAEVFASPSGSFTILVTRPDGRACAIAAGEIWTADAPVAGEPS